MDPFSEIGALIDRGDKDEALRKLRHALDTSPENELLQRVQLAKLFRRLDQLDQAEALVVGVIAQKPHHPDATVTLAFIHRHRGDHSGAAKLFLGLIDHFPNWHSLRYEAAFEYQALDQHEKATEQLTLFLAQNTDHRDARIRLGSSLRALGQHAAALELERAQPVATLEHVPTLISTGHQLEKAERFDEALNCFRRALSLAPGHHLALAAQARILDRLGFAAEALDAWHQAALAQPDALPITLKYADALSRLGRTDAALAYWQALTAAHADDVDVLVGAGLFYRRVGYHRESVRHLLKAHALAPDRPRLAMECARALASVHRWQEAWQMMQCEPNPTLDMLDIRYSILMRVQNVNVQEVFDSDLHASTNEERASLLAIARIYGLTTGDLPAPYPSKELAARFLNRPKQDSPLYERVTHAIKSHQCGDAHGVRQALSEAVTTALGASKSTKQEMEALLATLHRFGLTDLYQQLLTFLEQRHPGLLNIPAVIRQIAEQGDIDRATQWMDIRRDRIAPSEAFSLEVYLLRKRGTLELSLKRFEKAFSQHESIMLAELKTWARILIDLEMTQAAAELLSRFGSRFLPHDLLEEHADLLKMNLCFEDLCELLKQCLRDDPLHEEAALRLTRTLADLGQSDEAHELLSNWSLCGRREADWMAAELHVSFCTEKDWAPLFGVHASIARRPMSVFDLRMTLPHLIEHMMLCGWHKPVDRELDAFGSAMASVQTTPQHRRWMQLEHASRLMRWGRLEESTAILRALEPQLTPDMRDRYHHVSAANAAYKGDLVDFSLHVSKASQTRHRFTITPFHDADNPPEPVGRAAVLLHLYYAELWPKLANQLYNLRGTDFQLFVTVGAHQDFDAVTAMIRADFPSAITAPMENRGLDVGAHWQTLQTVDLSQYDVAVILHSKKSAHTRVGDIWRENMQASLMGSPSRWRENMAMFVQDEKLGIIGNGFHRNTSTLLLCPEMRQVLQWLGMPTDFEELRDIYEFVGGTMLMIRASLLKDMFQQTTKQISFEPYSDLSLAKRRDATYAHALERAFGLYSRWKGFNLLWRP